MNFAKAKNTIVHHTTVVLKVAIAAALLWWLFGTGKFDSSALLDPATGRFNFSIWYLCILLVPVSVGLLAYRWQQFLSLQQIYIGFGASLRLTLISNLFMVALPGMVGGDVVKAAYLCRNMNNRRLNVISATFMDRIMGAYALFMIGAIASVGLWAFPNLISSEFWEAVVSSRVILIPPLLFAAITLLLAMAMNELLYTRLASPLLNRVPMGGHLLRFLDTIYMHRRYPGRLSYLVGLSVLNHLLNIAIFMCVAMAIDEALPLLSQFFLNALAMVGNLVPITPGGIGLTEGVFHYLYLLAGSENGATIGLVSRLITYVVFVSSGLVVFILMRSHIEVQPQSELNSIPSRSARGETLSGKEL